MSGYSALLPAANEAVDLAAEIIRDRLPGALTAKGDRDLASEVDFAVERAVRAYLAERTPDIVVVGEEEGGAAPPDGMWWALDPIDGTVNFVHGLPLCAVSLGLVHRGRPVVGVVDLPFLGNRYAGAQGCGGYVDGRRLHARPAGDLAGSLVAFGDFAVGSGAGQLNRERLEVLEMLVPRVLRVRMLGAAAIDLAWLAEGKLDALLMFANKPWDTAAGVLLAREAGALVLDRDGSEHTMGSMATFAGAGPVLDELVSIVARVRENGALLNSKQPRS